MDPTLLIHWLFSSLAFATMLARLIWRKVAKQPFNLGDYLTMAACFCLLARAGLIHVVLTWKTNNIPASVRKTAVFTARDIFRRETGSKLSLVNRVFYNSYLWLQKLVLLDVYRRLLNNLPYEKVTIYSFLAVFFATYVACQVSTFIECQPIHLYWQVVPDPGTCAQAQVQLVVVGVTNIITDAMLLVLPIPLVTRMQAAWKLKVQLCCLFLLGSFIIAITIIRLPINSLNKDSQVNRSTWASTELLAAAVVVNAPTLYGMWNLKRKGRSGNSYGTGGLSNYGRGTTVTTARRGDGDDDKDGYMMSAMGRGEHGHVPNGHIMQTKEVMVTARDVRDADGRAYIHLPDDQDAASTSSQKSILKGSKK